MGSLGPHFVWPGQSILEAGKRTLSTPTLKKEPVTFGMIEGICIKYAGDDINLGEFCVAALCVTTFYGFLRFNEISSLRVVTSSSRCVITLTS